MQLSVNRAPLLRALGHIQNVIERRIPSQILSHILLYANEETLSLSGYVSRIESFRKNIDNHTELSHLYTPSCTFSF